jgi:DNA-binding response OmpR family regulator
MRSTPLRLLVIDDDIELTQALGRLLSDEGFEPCACASGTLALEALDEARFDLIILDVMLPGLSGLEVLRRLRLQHGVPVLMLTAKGDDLDKVLGLELGADDYLSKPFNPRELVARIRAILRRVVPVEGDIGKLAVGPLILDKAKFCASFHRQELRLTTAEFLVLEALARNPGVPQSRSFLTRFALGRTLEAYDRSIDTHVSNLRRKIFAIDEGTVEIRSMRGSGYFLTVSEPTP